MSLTLQRNFYISLFLLFLTGGLYGQVVLTTSPYTENFDNLGSGYPTGWTGRSGATASALGTTATLTTAPTAWNNTTGSFKNYASADGLPSNANAATQNASTDRSLGVRQTGSFGDPGAAFVLQLANTLNISALSVSFKLQSLDIASARTVTWQLQYAIGNTPTSFTNITTSPATLTTGGSTYTNVTVTATLPAALENQSDNVWIRIVTLTASTGSGARPTTGIDDFQLDFTVGNPITADHLQFDNPPADGLPGVPFQLTVCAVDPSDQIQPDYNTPIALNQTLGTPATITPASPLTPSGGCVTYTITPNAPNETIEFEASSGTLTDAQVSIDIWDTPTSCYTDNCNMLIVPVSTNEENDIWTCNSGTYAINGFCPSCSINTESWLVSQQYSITAAPFNTFNFTLNQLFTGPALEVFYTLNYSGDPNTTTWVSLGTAAVDGNYSFDFSGISGATVRFGIKYTANGQSGTSGGYEVSNIELKAVDCSNIQIGSCVISSIDVTYLGNCNNQGTTLVTDDTRDADITVNTNAWQPITGTIDLYVNNVLLASQSVNGSNSYTFSSQNLPANNASFTLSSSFSANNACSLSQTEGPLESCSPAFALAFNPPVNPYYYSGSQSTLTVCYVDENGNLSPQNPLPAVSLDDNPDLTTIGVPTADPNNACYHYIVDFNTQGILTFTATDNSLTATASTEIIDFPCVLISEVIDPTSGNNKYVEIFNGSSNPIDISNYKLNIYRNGSTTIGNTFLVWPGTILQPGYTYVFSNSASTLDYTDCGANVTMNTNINSNGDDAYELVDGYNAVVDRFGVVGEDPAPNTSWNYDNKVVHRNYDIYCGTPTFDLSEWTFENYSANNMGTPCHHCVDVTADIQLIGGTNPFCEGDLFNFDVTTTGGNYYQWSGPNGFSSTAKTTPSITASATTAGKYFVSVTTGPGCSPVVDSIEITVIPKPVAVASATPNPVCIGTSVQFGASGGDTYEWTGPDGFYSTAAAPILSITSLNQEGTYTLVAFNACTSDTTTLVLDVIEYYTVTPTASPNSACIGGSVQLDVEAANSYLWSGPNGFSSTIKNPALSNIQNNQAGTYSVTITYSSGCTGQGSVNVTVDPLPDAIATPITQDACSGEAITTIVLSGNVSGTIFNWTRDNTGNVTGIPASGSSDISGTLTNTTNTAQTVTFTITPTANGCSGTSITAIVNIPTSAVVDPESSVHYCNGITTSAIQFTGSFDYVSWTNDNPSIGLAASGTGDISSFVATNNGNTPVIANIVATGHYLNIDQNQPNADVNMALFGQGDLAQSFKPQNSIINGAGIFLLSGHGGNSTVTISLWTNLPNNGGIMLASGSSAGVPGNWVDVSWGNISVTPGTTYYLVFHSTDNTNSIGGAINNPYPNGQVYANPGYNPFPNFDYAFRTFFPGGCPSTPINFTLTVNPTPNVVANPVTQTVCSGPISTIALTGNVSGTLFIWTRDNTSNVTGIPASGSGDISGTLTNTTNTAQTVTFMITPAANGCLGTPISATVIVNPTPIVTATATPNPVCSGGTLSLGTVAGASYLWSGPNGFSSTIQNPTISNIQTNQSGTYNVTVTSSSGCTGTSSVSVTVNPVPVVTVTATPNPVCSGGTLSLGTIAGASYVWSGPNGFSSTIQNPTISNIQTNQSGTYSVTVTSSAGCTGTGSVSVTVNPVPVVTVTATPNPVCSGGTLSLGTIAGASYLWSGPNGFSSTIQNPTISNIQTNQSGTYSVTVTSSAGCTGTGSVSVTVNPLPSPTASVTPNPVCTGNKVQFTASGGLSYAWSGPDGFSSNKQNPGRFISSVSQGGTYTVTVTNAEGCSNTTTVNLVVNETPNGTISATPNPICEGSTLQLSATGGLSYLWSGPQGFTSTQQNPVINNFQYNQSGIYQVVISNNNGCTQTLTIKVEGLRTPYAEAAYEVSTACIGSTLQLYGKGIGYFNWSGPNGFTSTQQHPTIPNVTTQNSGTYYLTVTSPNGCTATSEVVVTIHDLPALDMPVPYVEACEGSTVQLFADGEGSFSWSGPWGFASEYQNPVIYTIPAYMTGYYVVELQGQTGCVAKDSMFVQVGGYIKADAWASPNPVCQGTTLKLHAEGGDYYLWTGPNGFTSTEQEPVIDNMNQNKEGTYGVLITTKEGCQTFLTVNVTMIPIEGEIWASANPNPISSQDRSFQLFASPGSSYLWTGPNGFTSTLQNPIVRITGPQVAGLYVVTITLNSGCPAVAKVIVRYNRLPKENPGFTVDESDSQLNNAMQYVFPNPTNSMLYFSTLKSGNIEYTIFNSQNKIVAPSQLTENKYVSVENLSSGVYYIRWKAYGDKEWTMSKFVKIQ